MNIPKRIQERRRTVRVEESLPFWIGHDGYELKARTVNLSSGGAMFETDRDIAMMTRLNVALTLVVGRGGKKTVVRAKGVVVRKEKDPLSGRFQIAVFFSDIKPPDRKLIQDFVDGRLKT